MNVSTQKFQSSHALVCKSLARNNHRTTLPQSRPLGVAAPSEREPGNVPIQRTARKPQRCGRFSSPLRNSEDLTCTTHRTTLPQSRPVGVTAPSEREPGAVAGAFAIHRTARKPQRCGRFSSPLRRLRMFNRSHSSGDTPSEREPGNVPIQRAARKPQGCGRFSSPLRNSECLTVPIHWREQKFLVFSYVSCVIRQIVVKWGKIYPAAPAGGG